ncbi:transketolase [Streptomyces sp. NPDC051940]|uniref:transketolase n=1 Tax=Streptomyces sp. NPDC051940 TaxID=3155675 RepID=UPI00343A6004
MTTVPDHGTPAGLGRQLRVDSVRAAAAAGSGHPTSSMSAADLVAVLFEHHLRYDTDYPDHPGNDRLIFSKGHASPLLYAALKAAGAVSDEELLTFRKLGSRLEGHPVPRMPWVDVATGSLGQGPAVGVGIALAGKRLGHEPFRVWVLCGDSEMAEGSVWEAFEHAGHEHLDNLTAVVDVNRLGQRGPTRHGWDLGAYARRAQAFGWHTVEIDGHDPAAIDAAYREAAATRGRPTAILARTVKGSGVASVADHEGMHGKPLSDPERAVEELGGATDLRIRLSRPPAVTAPTRPEDNAASLPRYELGDEVATRTAYGQALAAVGAVRPEVVALDGEVSDSTRTELFAKEHPERFFECYIAEQQLVAAAVGMQVLGHTPFVSTFAAFLTRAHDFVRMAAIGRADLNLAGSHAGVAIGADGPSQMGLEDLAMFRTVPGATVLYPCDANQTARLVEAMAGEVSGIRCLRTTRGDTPVIYGPDELFPIGGSRVLRHSDEDQVTIVAAGITVHEALAAADELAHDGFRARVIDLYSLKPVDTWVLWEAARRTGCLLTVEDHRVEGGLGDAVAQAFTDGRTPPRLTRLGVHGVPGSASPAEQLREAGIDADAIVVAARRLYESLTA